LNDERSETPEALRAKWDARYADGERVPEPAWVLTENLHLLPTSGQALDLACGLGVSALLLAERGLAVCAWDLSPVAIERLRTEAQRRGLVVDAQVRDVQRDPPAPESFDLILVAHFLDRTLAAAIAAALRPGGLLFYQTFTREAVSASGPSNPDYRLAPNELLRLFPDLLVRVYREEGRVGDLAAGTRDLAVLVGERAG
jgi:SAM-dependent methyltransferase